MPTVLMSILTSRGVWAGAGSLAVGILSATGYGPAAAILSDPHMVAAGNVLLTAVVGAVAGVLPAPGHTPEAPQKAPMTQARK